MVGLEATLYLTHITTLQKASTIEQPVLPASGCNLFSIHFTKEGRGRFFNMKTYTLGGNLKG